MWIWHFWRDQIKISKSKNEIQSNNLVGEQFPRVIIFSPEWSLRVVAPLATWSTPVRVATWPLGNNREPKERVRLNDEGPWVEQVHQKKVPALCQLVRARAQRGELKVMPSITHSVFHQGVAFLDRENHDSSAGSNTYFIGKDDSIWID